VNTYRRRCVVTTNPDGSLQVTAKGTELNPENGFEFSLHGGPHQFSAKGELHAFELCEGPFVALAHTVIDNGVMTYELRFKQHCMIVIR
jgi:hypothetical protein